MGKHDKAKTAGKITAFAAICVTILLLPTIATLMQSRSGFAMPANRVETFETYLIGATPSSGWTTMALGLTGVSFTTVSAGGSKAGRFIDSSTTAWPSIKFTTTTSPKAEGIAIGVTVTINSIGAEGFYVYASSSAYAHVYAAFTQSSGGTHYVNVYGSRCINATWATGDTWDMKYTAMNATGWKIDLRRNGVDLAPSYITSQRSIADYAISNVIFQNSQVGALGLFDITLDNICISW